MLPRILVCYSNPLDTSRLRLDVEHAELEEAVRTAGCNSVVLRKVLATRAEDLVSELTSHRYEVVQFSGHGSEDGIYLECSDRVRSKLLDVASLREILSVAPASLRVLILTCCHSAAYRDELSPHVPYLISVIGPTDDEAAIQFSKYFFSNYLKSGSVEVAIRLARMFLKSGIEVTVSRRGLQLDGFIIQAAIDSEVILIDLSRVRTFIESLTESGRDQFIDAISTTMRAHFSLFSTAMNRVAIPFGEYIGIFSWYNEVDPVVCEHVFVVSNEITEDEFGVIAKLLVRYTTLARRPYSRHLQREYPNKGAIVRMSLSEFHHAADTFFNNDYASVFRKFHPNAYKNTAGFVRASLSEADSSLAKEDFDYAIAHIEAALTSLHNFIKQLLRAIEG